MATGAASTSGSLPAAAVVAACALIFTVASFWWLNARQGRLRSYPPHTFAAAATRQKTLIRIPLVLFNTGPKPIVILDMRLDVARESQEDVTLPWSSTRDRIRPEPEDGLRLPAVFAVSGRAAEQAFIEFSTPFPNFTPQLREYRASLKCRVGHRKKWITVMEFPLHLENVSAPGSYIAYSNAPNVVDESKKISARDELNRLASEAAIRRSND